MQHPITIAGIGELLWDVLDTGEQIGGAPVNFAYHVHALGGRGIPISTIGRDERGRRALDELGERGLDTATISERTDHVTGYVLAATDPQGVATYTFPDDVAWDHLVVNREAKAMAHSLDGICFGTLAQRHPDSRTIILDYLDALPADVLKILDLNLRQDFYSPEIIQASLVRCNVLKLSDEELPVVAPMLRLQGEDPEVLEQLCRRYRLQLVILTRGPRGCLVHSPEEHLELPGLPTTVVDTIGAGDSFTAAIALGYLLRKPLAEAAGHANRLAAYVCSCPGAMPPIPDAMRIL